MNESDAVHDDAVQDDGVHDGEAQDDVVRGVLHDWVKDVYAPAELASRAEAAARRRRATRWSVTSALAVVALGVTVGTFAVERSGGGAGHPAVSAVSQHPLACAATENAYKALLSPVPQASAAVTTVPPMPGDPDGAVLCRYAGFGEAEPAGSLAGKATVTDPGQLAQLKRAINSGDIVPPNSVEACAANRDQIAVVLISYPGVSAVRTVLYERYCGLLISDSTSRFAGGGFDQLVTAWTGDWRPTATQSAP